MWAKHWREVLKYLRLCLHVFSGSVSYDVTASARDSLLQWLLELNASFFHILTQTHTRLQKYVSIYVHMHTERQIQSDSALHSTCLISFKSSVLYCSLALFKMPKATFPTLLVSVLGYRAFEKAGPATLPSVGQPLLKAFSVGQEVSPSINHTAAWDSALILHTSPRESSEIFFLVVTWSQGRKSRSGCRGCASPNHSRMVSGMLCGDHHCPRTAQWFGLPHAVNR